MYSLQIHTDEMNYFVGEYNSKKEAVKKASKLRRIGNFFSDSLTEKELENSLVIVTHKGNEIYVQPFTRRYINRSPLRSKSFHKA